MIRPWHLLLLLASSCSLLALSCASEQVQIIEADDDDEQGGRDIGGSVATFGEPCDSSDDCDSELCLFDPAFDEQYCSRTCEVTCNQDGWSCVEISVGDDTESVCLRDDDATTGEDDADDVDDDDTDVTLPDPPDATDVPETTPPACTGVCTAGQVEDQSAACGACGTGTQSRRRTCGDDCTWGPWVDGACDTEGTLCSPGSTEREERACAGCGAEVRTRDCATDGCGFGAWSDWSGCGATACTPGQTESESESCGTCGSGTRTRTRSCESTGCGFGAWSDWGACSEVAACTPGQTDSETRSCGPCGGTQTRTRGCNASTCSWNAWGDWSACPARTCLPGATTGCDNGDSCGHRVCNSSCEWGACEPRVAGGCLRIRPGTSGPAGNNWRCCGGGSWQFCLATCQWSTDCAPCSGCGC